MELNKRKSLLTPASPTCWGQIHGDINNQKDLRDVISEKVKEVVGIDLINSIKSEILAEINPLIGEITETTQPKLETGINIKSLKGRSILGEGDLDPLDENDRMTIENLESNTQSALMKSDAAQNIALSATTSVSELRGYVDENITNLESNTQTALNKSDTAQNMALSATTSVSELRGYVDENITNLESNTQTALNKSDTAQIMALSATTSVDELRGYVDEQIGGINTITEDILG